MEGKLLRVLQKTELPRYNTEYILMLQPKPSLYFLQIFSDFDTALQAQYVVGYFSCRTQAHVSYRLLDERNIGG